jgi:hypothetical protein
VQGREYTNLDVSMCSLLTLRMSIKEIHKIVDAMRLQNICEWKPWNIKHWDPNNVADELRVNLKSVPSNCSLHDEASLILLSHYHVPTKLYHQTGINQVGTVIKISPVIVLN